MFYVINIGNNNDCNCRQLYTRRLDCLQLLDTLFGEVKVAQDVYNEVCRAHRRPLCQHITTDTPTLGATAPACVAPDKPQLVADSVPAGSGRSSTQ